MYQPDDHTQNFLLPGLSSSSFLVASRVCRMLLAPTLFLCGGVEMSSGVNFLLARFRLGLLVVVCAGKALHLEGLGDLKET